MDTSTYALISVDSSIIYHAGATEWVIYELLSANSIQIISMVQSALKFYIIFFLVLLC
jgi:hypothetical protein